MHLLIWCAIALYSLIPGEGYKNVYFDGLAPSDNDYPSRFGSEEEYGRATTTEEAFGKDLKIEMVWLKDFMIQDEFKKLILDAMDKESDKEKANKMIEKIAEKTSEKMREKIEIEMGKENDPNKRMSADISVKDREKFDGLVNDILQKMGKGSDRERMIEKLNGGKSVEKIVEELLQNYSKMNDEGLKNQTKKTLLKVVEIVKLLKNEEMDEAKLNEIIQKEEKKNEKTELKEIIRDELEGGLVDQIVEEIKNEKLKD
uniref:DUF148 domain-containing protein n=1 Tax=Meloidogyne hapla TaxID=6305 RepID=A0A1I8BX36_MELHA